jgi:hypothetical protein
VSNFDSYPLERDPKKPNRPELSDTCVEAIGRRFERALPPDFIHDQYRQDKAGYYEFIAYEEPGEGQGRILQLRVCPAERLRYQLVGFFADQKRGRSREVIYAEGDGDLDAFLRDRLEGAIQGLREVGQEDITVPWAWPKG